MKLVYIFSLLIFVFVYQVFADSNITSGFEYLRTDFSPRTAATSNAFLTLSKDVSSMFINPAGLSSIDQRQFTFNYTNYLLDINGGIAAYAQKFERFGVLSVGLIYMDYGEFDETDENANPIGGTFSANEMALGVGISNHLDQNIAYGVNLKYAFSKIHDYNASAVAIDFGLMYVAPFQDNLNFAISVLNVGTNFEYYADTKETLPLNLRVGFSKKLAHLPLEIAASLNNLNLETEDFVDRFKRFAVGGEFRFSEMLRLRLGYNNDLHSSLGTATDEKFGGISGGLGIYWKNLRFDYAYSNFSSLGSIHRFGITGSLD